MLKELFSNRFFIGALACFILCVVGGTLYISHVEKQGAEELATDENSVKQVTEKQQQQPPVKAPVGDISRGGHFHEDGTWHSEPHEASVTTAERLTEKQKLQKIAELEKKRAELKKENAELKREVAEKQAIIAEVHEFDNWVANIDFYKEFGELITVRTLPVEEIKKRYTPDELKKLLDDTVSRFHSYREEFLGRLENSSSEARAIIMARIHSNPETSQIYEKYIVNASGITGGIK